MITQEKIDRAEAMWQKTVDLLLLYPENDHAELMFAHMANTRLLIDIMTHLKEKNVK